VPDLASGLPDTSYYAPNFKVTVENQEMDPETRGDVLDIKVMMDLEQLTRFELTINNWDDKNFEFKYVDNKLFDPGNRVQIQLGYADKLVSMVTGIITTLTPRFPESGPPTLVVAGLDGMFLLRDRKPVGSDRRQWSDLADWEIVREIATRNKLNYDPTTTDAIKQPLVVQRNLDDAQFVMERARRIDFDCFVSTDAKSGKSTLHFRKPTDAREKKAGQFYSFEWGTNLINFTPTLTTSRQVSTVLVRGWNPKTKEPIEGKASKDDLPNTPKGGLSGPEIVLRKLGDKHDVVVDFPVRSKEEANALAKSLLLERAYDYVTGSGQCIGLPELRPGDNVELTGLGDRFSGTYYIKKADHTFGDNGYRTQFEVRKLHDGGQIPT
jgi:phage protein D